MAIVTQAMSQEAKQEVTSNKQATQSKTTTGRARKRWCGERAARHLMQQTCDMTDDSRDGGKKQPVTSTASHRQRQDD